MKTVFVLVDALKSLYLNEENMPFLYGFANENFHINKIVPSPGFCERCEVFSGLGCFDTGNFTAIGYDSERGYYKNSSIIIKIASAMAKVKPRFGRALLKKYRDYKKIPLKPYRIPFKSLKNYVLTEDGEHQYIKYKTIFDVMSCNNMKYTLDGFTSLSDIGKPSINNYIDFLKENLKNGMEFIPIYFGKIDTVGHKYGNDVDKIKPHLQEVDNLLWRLFEVANEYDARFCVLGDHGMVPIENRINMTSILEKNGLLNENHYEMFLDSTIARFWFDDSKNIKIFKSFFENELSDYGYCITEDNFELLRVPMDIKGLDGYNVYGQLIWAARPGTLISPDYFHDLLPTINGMHGYIDVDSENGVGLFCSNHKKEKSLEKHLYEVTDFLCESLEIETPNKIGWSRIKND